MYTLAGAYELNKQYTEGLEVINKAIELSGDRRLYRYQKKILLGDLNIFDQRYTEAENMIKKYKK